MSEIILEFPQGLTETEEYIVHITLVDHPAVDMVLSELPKPEELAAYRPVIQRITALILPEVKPTEFLTKQLVGMLPPQIRAKNK